MTFKSGRHFLQIPGPSNVPDRVLRAIDNPTMDHRGPDFGIFAKGVLEDMKKIFQTEDDVIIYPASGTGAWEAALSNTLSPGDKVLMSETGQFATLWCELAKKLGIEPEFITTDWRRGAVAADIEARLREDTNHEIKAVGVVHSETSTGAVSNVAKVRAAIDAANHPALLLVDTISGLGSLDFQHDEWGIDVSVGCSQKGLMLPPGLSFNAVSKKAIAASEKNTTRRSYWDWAPMLANNATGFFPYTPSTNLLYGLREAIDMLLEEGLDNVFKRHDRYAEATRRAVQAWGLEVLCQNPDDYSSILTAVMVPDGHDADHVRNVILDNFDMSLGTGLGKVKGKIFRIGHLGDFNDLTLMGTLSGVEMGLSLADIPHQKGGVDQAMAYLTETAGSN